MKRLFYLVPLVVASVAWGAEGPWAVVVSSKTPCPPYWECWDKADDPLPDFKNKVIDCHPENQEACQDFVEAMNEANQRREWMKHPSLGVGVLNSDDGAALSPMPYHPEYRDRYARITRQTRAGDVQMIFSYFGALVGCIQKMKPENRVALIFFGSVAVLASLMVYLIYTI